MAVKDLTITSLETIDVFNLTTGAFKYRIDELQSFDLKQTQEKKAITGKQGRTLANLKRNKAVTISGTNGLISGGLIASQTGCEFSNKATHVLWTDYLTVGAEHTALTNWTAIGTSGAEIDACYIRNDDGTLGTELTQASAAAAGKFAYAPATKTLTFHTDVTSGTEVVVYYHRNITTDVLENSSTTYSEKCTMYVNALAEDICGNVYRVQIYIPKADFSGEFSMTFGSDQAVHKFDADALAGSCGTSGQFFTYTVFGENATDTPVSA